jgi:hypothetical protein
VLGDLNDERPAAATQILLGPPGRSLRRRLDRADKGDGMRSWNLAPRLAALHPDRALTSTFRDRGELIDHILISHVLAHALDDVNTADVTPPSVTENPTERRDAPASDHARWSPDSNLTWLTRRGRETRTQALGLRPVLHVSGPPPLGFARSPSAPVSPRSHPSHTARR